MSEQQKQCSIHLKVVCIHSIKMKDQTKTQEYKVLKILRENGKIDNFFCIDTKLTIPLGAVIHKLSKKGLIELDEAKCGYVEGKNYQYVIKPLVPKRVDRFFVDGKEVAPPRTIW